MQRTFLAFPNSKIIYIFAAIDSAAISGKRIISKENVSSVCDYKLF